MMVSGTAIGAPLGKRPLSSSAASLNARPKASQTFSPTGSRHSALASATPRETFSSEQDAPDRRGTAPFSAPSGSGERRRIEISPTDFES